ncbi:DUF3558 domain-containing protein [Amycolatopsis azurea]|uniref:DUF3558 domain-containing protein n=1 Tax=Amycolatopsis azurea DSM 43854 TaxID=1238180 RepID=M2NM48_9PSEU|nr:DUF3558 domain-containing protein [Amycolatopsis azurea]EMD23229.1 hypothetical protein C791_7469 [Amycolatopsis azurea DSM 43854]OOC06122.1 hypothetical protein B0293_13780 [Amycolatopsis azurea DSM 43854]
MNRRLIRGLATLIVGGFAVLAGCGTSPPPRPPAPSVSVPPIPAQLNGNKFIADPCSAITVDQLQSIGFGDGRHEQTREGQCLIVFGSSVDVTTSWFPPLRTSISTLYRDRVIGRDTGNHWEEVTINGYPAVIVDVEANIPSRRDKGPLACRLVLGVDDSTLVHIKANTWGKIEAGPWQADPCGAVKKIAEFVIDNLRS